MEFMDLFKEWLALRDDAKSHGGFVDWDRMAELEAEINKRMRGEL